MQTMHAQSAQSAQSTWSCISGYQTMFHAEHSEHAEHVSEHASESFCLFCSVCSFLPFLHSAPGVPCVLHLIPIQFFFIFPVFFPVFVLSHSPPRPWTSRTTCAPPSVASPFPAVPGTPSGAYGVPMPCDAVECPEKVPRKGRAASKVRHFISDRISKAWDDNLTCVKLFGTLFRFATQCPHALVIRKCDMSRRWCSSFGTAFRQGETSHDFTHFTYLMHFNAVFSFVRRFISRTFLNLLPKCCKLCG